MFKNFDELYNAVRGKTNRIVIPGANNLEVLTACLMGRRERLISGGILIGPVKEIKTLAAKAGLDLEGFSLIDKSDYSDVDKIYSEMCNLAVDLVKAGEGDFLVKGLVDTKWYMRGILRKEAKAFPEGNLLSHFALFETGNYHKMFVISDVAVIPSPTLEQKAGIIANSVDILHSLGVENPKVSIVCPVEKINPKIQSTVDAGELVKMNRDGRIKGCTIEGPYDTYITFSKAFAEEKGIRNAQVPGEADLVILHDLNAANVMYKSICVFGSRVRNASILTGVNIPVVLPSRADSPDTKLNSIALACYLKDRFH